MPLIRGRTATSLAILPAASERDSATSGGDRFQILRPHARGGHGEVFVALDTELNREVALKTIQAPYADDPRFRSRFLFEAEVTGSLEHPGIVPVYGLGRSHDGRPYYAMRFIEGKIQGSSLRDAIRRFHDAEKQPGRDPGEAPSSFGSCLGGSSMFATPSLMRTAAE